MNKELSYRLAIRAFLLVSHGDVISEAETQAEEDERKAAYPRDVKCVHFLLQVRSFSSSFGRSRVCAAAAAAVADAALATATTGMSNLLHIP